MLHKSFQRFLLVSTVLITGVTAFNAQVNHSPSGVAMAAKNPNTLLTQYRIGQVLAYDGDNNRVVLNHFPKSEKDNSGRVHNHAIDKNTDAHVKVLAKRTAKWHVDYYQIKFPDGKVGWVNQSDLVPTNFDDLATNHNSKAAFKKAARQTAFNYLNQVRRAHGLKPYAWNTQLAKVAQKRTAQLPKHFSHYDTNGQKYTDEVIASLGDYSIFGTVGENIGQTYVAKHWVPRQVALITDDNVAPHYLATVKASLESAGFRVAPFIIPHGEQSKSLAELARIATGMAELHFNRSDAVIALGGGVVGDLAGFVAATYMRGIDLIQVPTSLLAQVDSSVGCKTAVDLNHVKNIIGSFHQPQLVIIDSDTLETLNERDLVEGYGEVVKCATLTGGAFWKLVLSINHPQDLLRSAEALIEFAVAFKARVVMADEKKSGERQKLNFGHTIGHGVEALANGALRHGEAVSIGMVEISQLLSSSEVTEQIKARLNAVSLPVTSPLLSNPMLIEKIKNDKKNHHGYLNIIYLTAIGEPVIKRFSINEISRMIQERS